ncbi:B12-binding domain-containing radical SAM protein [Chloroflexota bacterium]
MNRNKKDKIILINSSLSYTDEVLENRVFPTTAIMLLATVLREAGWRISLLDGNLHNIKHFKKELNKHLTKDVLYIGMSVMTCQVPWSYQIAEFIKSRRPGIPIIWGGVHPTLFPEQTAQDANVDFVVMNEAISNTILPLTEAISKDLPMDGIPGVCYKKGGGIIKTGESRLDDIKDVPFIDFTLMDHRRYAIDNILWSLSPGEMPKVENVTYPIVTGLGCAYKCKFCINVLLHRRYRRRSALEIVDRIEFLQKEYGAKFIQFFDEDFFINKARTFEFLDLVEERGLKFYYRVWLRVNHFRDDYINVDVAQRLYKHGMIIAVMGAESGSQQVLDSLDKEITVAQIIHAADVLKETKIIPKFSFMAGLPGETRSDLLETKALVEKLRSENSKADVAVINYRPYPGSPLYDTLRENQLLPEPDSLREWSTINTSKGYGYFSIEDSKWISDPDLVRSMIHV